MKTKLLTALLFLSLASPAEAHGHHHRRHHVKSETGHLLRVKSDIVLVFDEQSQSPIFDKNSNDVVPIASITKLMTAMVTLDANLPMDEMVPIGEDNPNIKRSKSRLKVGVCLSRRELLQLALMSSENRAALALANSYPGGLEAFLIAMNLKAAQLEMSHTVFFDPTGLDLRNVSTAQDLVKMVVAASSYSVIHDFTTTSSREVDDVGTRKPLKYHNTNPLVSTSQWDIGLSKTGYIKEAGRCLVMQTVINGSPVVIVILHSRTKRGRVTDAKIIKNWVEKKLPITIKDEMILPPVPPASPFLPEDVPMCTAVQPVPSLTM